MRKLFPLFGSIAGGYLGWWLGSSFGLMTAFLLSVTGSGIGIYFGARFGGMYGD